MTSEAGVKIKLPENNVMSHIFVPFHVTSQQSNYNVIFDRDLPWGLRISLDFQKNCGFERHQDVHETY